MTSKRLTRERERIKGISEELSRKARRLESFVKNRYYQDNVFTPEFQRIYLNNGNIDSKFAEYFSKASSGFSRLFWNESEEVISEFAKRGDPLCQAMMEFLERPEHSLQDRAEILKNAGVTYGLLKRSIPEDIYNLILSGRIAFSSLDDKRLYLEQKEESVTY